MFIQKVIAGVLGVNCYVIADEITSKAAVIDPGGSLKEIEQVIEDNFLELEYIILTHGHGDHIGAALDLKRRNKCKIIAYELEKEILEDASKNLSAQLGLGCVQIQCDEYVVDGQIVKLGDLELKIIHTPGHTPGGMCIIVEDAIFSGDTLFAGSIGRTDFYGGDYDELMKSLKKLSNLNDEYTVLSGHGPATRLGIEKVTNPYMI